MKKKRSREAAIREIFKAGSDKHRGDLNIYVTERDVEKEGKELFELYAIHHIEQVSY